MHGDGASGTGTIQLAVRYPAGASFARGVDVLVTTYYVYIIMARLMGLSCSLAEDQNFDRQTWLRSQPNLVPCLLPSGKYISTVRWTLLSAKDWFPQLFLLVAFARRKPDFRE